jgi:hypothetical protein
MTTVDVVWYPVKLLRCPVCIVVRQRAYTLLYTITQQILRGICLKSFPSMI